MSFEKQRRRGHSQRGSFLDSSSHFLFKYLSSARDSSSRPDSIYLAALARRSVLAIRHNGPSVSLLLRQHVTETAEYCTTSIVIIALVYWPLPVSLYIDVYSFIQRPLAVVLRVWHASNKFATADEMQGYSIASFTNSHGGILPLPHQGHASVLDFRHLLTDLLFHVSSLFVEPAKSVPSNKVSFKDGATSPSYGESRHPSSRSEISDRRNGLRRANVRIYGPMQRAMRNSHDQLHQNRHLPWIDAPREQDRADYSAADPLPRTFRGSQEALRDMTRTNESRGEPVEEWTDPIIRNYWRDSPPPLSQVTGEPDSMTEALELGWWPFEAPVPTTRSGRLERVSEK